MVVNKDRNLFEESLPADGTLLISNEVRTNFQALDRANELRLVLGSTPDLPSGGTALNLYVEPGSYASDGQSTKFWSGGFTPDYGSVSWPEIVTSLNYRTDVISINSSGSLMITIGSESASSNPPPPTYPSDVIPIAEITFQRTSLISPGITTFDDPGVTIRDVRPMYVISAAGFGINPMEETLVATSGQTLFTLSSFTYTVGASEINVFVGGIRKVIVNDYTEVGAPTAASNQILFNTGLPLNETVTIYKVGAASAHRLSDLDDVSVETADAVTDPSGVRTVPYVGPSYSGGYVCNSNNPFATFADLTSGVGAIPFGIEHNAGTGVHGPKVTIVQSNDDNALVVTRSHLGSTGAAVVITNSGASPSLSIVQSGDSRGIYLQQIGNGNSIEIVHQNTSSSIFPLFISRVVGVNREPLIVLRDNTSGGVGANITISGHEMTFADETNARRFVFDVSTASLTLQNGGNNNHLTINKTSGGAGSSVQVTHLGTGNAIQVSNSGSGAALVLNVTTTSTKTIQVIKGAATTTLDALWVGPTSYADAYHTHAAAALNGGLGIALVELNDVDSNLSNAIVDVGGTSSPYRSSSATADNPLATMDDVDTRTSKIKTGNYSGNGSSQTIALGYQPDWVQIYNETDNTQSGVFIANGASGRYFRIAGSAGVSIGLTGFSLTDGSAPVNKSGDTYYYIAFKSTP